MLRIFNYYFFHFIPLMIFPMAFMSCGGQEFGATPQSTEYSPNKVSSYYEMSCSDFTLIKPKVDIVYFVDNSQSSYYLGDDLRSTIAATATALSKDFDFRLIGTQLLPTEKGNQDYQVLSNSVNLSGLPSDYRRISHLEDLKFFQETPSTSVEKGLSRSLSFLQEHLGSLIRQESHLIVVLISNGRDLEIEEDAGFGNGETRIIQEKYDLVLNNFKSLKNSLQSVQLRFLTATAKSVCKAGFRTAFKSYVKMSHDLYDDSGAEDNHLIKDSYDLCNSGGVSQIFSAINSSIQQVLIPHQYRFWPITFAENNEMVSIDDIKVSKISSDGSTQILEKNTDWTYLDQGSARPLNTRELPTSGESITARHFIQLTQLLTYPDCLVVTSRSKTEYFNYIVLPQKPRSDTLSVRINGKLIPESMTNGWSDQTSVVLTRNIKAAYPAAGDENPPIIKTGYMLKINDPSFYYHSGDKVEVSYIPESI